MTTIRRAGAALLLVSSMTLVGDRARAQERQGCFMVNPFNQLIDLTELCPVQTPASASASAGEPTLGTGDIQTTLRWQSTDDLDLAVTDPSGNEVSFLNPSIPSGGQLDVDANAGCLGELTQTPVENVFWPPSEAPSGDYRVSVRLFERCGAGAEAVPFEVRLLVQGETQPFSGSVSEANPVAEFAFSVP